MRRKNEIIYDYAEFSGIPIPSLNQQLNQFHQLINQEWHAIDSSNWNEITRQFYAQSEHYILDLLCANPDRMEIERKLEEYQVWQFFAQLNKKLDILEFGGGLGGACQLFQEKGYQPTYLDIPGKPMEFATWRYAKYNINIPIIKSNPEKLVLEHKYDVIFSDAVFEHLINPEQVANELMLHLRENGYMLILIDTFNLDDEWPMHRVIDFENLDLAVAEAGGKLIQRSPNKMINIWQKI